MTLMNDGILIEHVRGVIWIAVHGWKIGRILPEEIKDKVFLDTGKSVGNNCKLLLYTSFTANPWLLNPMKSY